MALAEAGEAARMTLGGHHVVVFPFPAAGHINPCVSFARSLARYGVVVALLCPKHELSKVKRSVTDDESFDARENVKLVGYEVPVGAGGLDIVSINALKYFMYDNVDEFDRIIGELMVEPRTVQYPSPCNGGPPVCIVSDMFLGFTQSIAEKFNIVRYCLFPSPVHFLSLFLHLPKFNAEGLIPIKPEDEPLIILNFPPIPHGDLPSSQHANNGNPGSHRFLLNEAQQQWKAAGVLASSVEELERPTLEGLRHYIDEVSPSDQALKVWPIGPLVEGVREGRISLRENLRETQEEGQYVDWSGIGLGLARGLARGLDLEKFSTLFRASLTAGVCKSLLPFVSSGHVVFTNTDMQTVNIEDNNSEGLALDQFRLACYVRLTDPKGFLLSNEVIASIFSALPSGESSQYRACTVTSLQK